MPYQRHVRLAFATTAICLVTFVLLHTSTSTRPFILDTEDYEIDSEYFETVSCGWLGTCTSSPSSLSDNVQPDLMTADNSWEKTEDAAEPEASEDGAFDVESFSKYRPPQELPQYIMDYAPLVHLHSQEIYWPSTMETHLEHVSPCVDYAPVAGAGQNRTVYDLHKLNKEDGARGWHVFLDSNDDVVDMPPWLTSEYGIPVVNQSLPYSKIAEAISSGKARIMDGSPNEVGKSSAPAILIIVEKEDGIVDAFWFFFYSFNLGNGIFGIRFGNHVGDWEHTMIRFVNGTPSEMFLSEHEFGVSYSFEAMEKQGKRPVIYSGIGTHAMYATPGKHPYIVPFGILKDVTDRGPLWDPAMNFHSYHFDNAGTRGEDRGPRRRSIISSNKKTRVHDDFKSLTPTTYTPDSPTSWFHFSGHWGGKLLPASDKRQYAVFSEHAYVNGPPGPKYKALGRKHTCLRRGGCPILTSTAPSHWVLVLIKDWVTVCAVFWLAFVAVWCGLWVATVGGRSASWILWGWWHNESQYAGARSSDERTALLPEQNETTQVHF